MGDHAGEDLTELEGLLDGWTVVGVLHHLTRKVGALIKPQFPSIAIDLSVHTEAVEITNQNNTTHKVCEHRHENYITVSTLDIIKRLIIGQIGKTI